MLWRCVIYVRSSLVLGFVGSRALSSSHLAGRALCEWISESFVPARVLRCSLEALKEQCIYAL